MKKIKSHNIICFILVTVSIFIGTLSSVALAQGTIELKAADAYARHSVWAQGFMLFQQRVSEEAKGTIKLNFIGGPEAFPPFELIEAVRRGLVDIADIVGAYYVSQVPEADAMKLSRLTPWEERESGAYDLFRKIIAQKANAYYLGKVLSPSKFNFYTKPKVEKMADFKGLKIRVSPLYKSFVIALGAVPVTMAHSEIYTALERGVVDGLGIGQVGIYETGYHEHLRYIIEPKFYENDQGILINLDTWNRLPEDVRKLLTAIMIKVEKESADKIRKLAEQERLALIQAGLKVITLQDAEKYLDLAYDSAWNDVLKKCPQYGPQLKKLLEK